MLNQSQIFESKEFGKFEVLTIDGKPYFPAKECAEILGYVKTRNAISRHCPHALKRGGVSQTTNQHGVTTNQTVEKVYIPEGDLYRLIIRSKLPEAIRFEAFVCDEILPSIRKYGGYITGETLEQLLADPDLAMKYFAMLKAERDKNAELLGKVEQLAPKARYHDIILQCENAVQASIIAKDYGMTCVYFNKLLQKLKIQYKIGATWVLYKEYAGKGYTVSKTYHVNDQYSKTHSYWTQSGRRFLYDILKWYSILPEAEKPGGAFTGGDDYIC